MRLFVLFCLALFVVVFFTKRRKVTVRGDCKRPSWVCFVLNRSIHLETKLGPDLIYTLLELSERVARRLGHVRVQTSPAVAPVLLMQPPMLAWMKPAKYSCRAPSRTKEVVNSGLAPRSEERVGAGLDRAPLDHAPSNHSDRPTTSSSITSHVDPDDGHLSTTV